MLFRSGCPCIAFDCNTGPREIIKHGENGLLIPPEDIEQLSLSMSFLINSEKMRSKFKYNSAKDVMLHFNTEKILSCWANVIDGLLNYHN